MNTEKKPELWAGVECTINRVGDRYFNQLERSGHATRLEDLDRFAELGIKKIRYPVLWEMIAPGNLENADWEWADKRLNRLRELGVCPIAGLLHHGSGPRHTSLLDPVLPDKLAAYAAAVAERYPWLKYFTPVNEPLTTARFSGLYGHWYPHGKDTGAFAKTLTIQCEAVIRSMKSIRKIIPDAQLIQTEDICKVRSTPLLSYQADFENERRWLSLDLLCGKINERHPLWNTLLTYGISSEKLDWFQENACPPDIIGVNHYLTSNRFLDEDLHKYPEHYHGGNGRHRYADVEAAGRYASPVAVYSLLREVWERYHLPIAITEVHLCGPREEQLRWFREFWDAAVQLQKEGIDLRAVTAWSLLGAFDWNCLVTSCNGFYESGVFDLRGPVPRPTALSHMLSCLSAGKEFNHPVLGISGFWKRSDEEIQTHVLQQAAPLLIIGAGGTLGRSFARYCRLRYIPYRALSKEELDITDIDAINKVIEEHKPWAVINTSGYVKVDNAESDPDFCFQVNAYGPALLAEAISNKGIQLITFSSDLVFDGNTGIPYVESDKVSPLNVYGNSKALCEKHVLSAFPGALVVRTSSFFSPWDSFNFITRALETIGEGKFFKAAYDIFISPTYVPDLVNACLDLLLDRESGLWHLANQGVTSWSDFARSAAAAAGLDTSLIQGYPSDTLNSPALRPRFSALSSEKGILLPPLTDALTRYLRDRVASIPLLK